MMWDVQIRSTATETKSLGLRSPIRRDRRNDGDHRAGFFAASCKAYFKGEIFSMLSAKPCAHLIVKDLMSKYGPRSRPGSTSAHFSTTCAPPLLVLTLLRRLSWARTSSLSVLNGENRCSIAIHVKIWRAFLWAIQRRGAHRVHRKGLWRQLWRSCRAASLRLRLA